ncbi:hypothetical protein BASA50_000262 [Batrachochytrium salamandrivorans]|uniref:VWFD domain-containing protein n=1 Tax=Batrachochytrium salamandrivorans TaxID=1357716 RepID=A0ABQ8EUQ9_9FUNG|nr:hypothetical protein BASA50_000262 [Batrachochytrium salamandrivorans]
MTPAIRTSWKAVLVAALIGLSQAAVTDTHSVSIVLVVDDSYSLSIDGVKSEVPYSGSSWSTVKNLTKTLTGDGPWLISLAATDYGNVAGLFAAVNLDGVPYSTTATSTNKFRMTPVTPGIGWDTNPLYPDGQWYTQTSDVCTGYNSQWASMLTTLDSMTKGQVARSMWYPDCTATGTNAAPKKMFFRLVLSLPPPCVDEVTATSIISVSSVSSRVAIVSPATASAAVPTTTVLSASHKIDVTMVVDDAYDLSLDGENHSVAVSDSSWYNIQTYTKTVYGDGPWLISVHGYDIGTIAGLFAQVSLDGVVYSTTAAANNKFRMTPNTPTSGWNTNVSYPDSNWYTQTTDVCASAFSLWATMFTTLDKKTTGQVARGMWYPDCYNVGSFSNPKHMYFRMKVIAPKATTTSTIRVVSASLVGASVSTIAAVPVVSTTSLLPTANPFISSTNVMIATTRASSMIPSSTTKDTPISTIATTSAAPIVRVASSSIAVVVPTTSAAPIPYVASSSIAVVAPTTSAAPIPYVASSSIAVVVPTTSAAPIPYVASSSIAVVVPTTSAAPIPYVASSSIAVVVPTTSAAPILNVASSSIAVVVPTTSVARIVYVASSSIAVVVPTTSAAPILNVASSSIAVVVPTTSAAPILNVASSSIAVVVPTTSVAPILNVESSSIAVVAPTTSVAPIVRVASSSIAVVAPTTSAAPIPYVESSSTAPAYAATSTSAAVKPTHKPVPRHRAHPRSDDTIVVIRLSDPFPKYESDDERSSRKDDGDDDYHESKVYN